MKTYLLAAAAATALGGAAYGQTPTCNDNAQSCNIAGVFKTNSSVVDSNDNTYAPDSASANANVGDIIAQGGASDSKSSATGNMSNNHNQSSANNSLSNSNDNKSSALSYNNGTFDNRNNNADSFTGSNTQGQSQGQGQAQSIGNTSATGGAGGEANATGGNGGKATASGGHSSASGGKSASNSGSSSGGNIQRGGNVNVDASVRNRQAAASAATVIPGGYGGQNCFGDTNPSGSFGMSVQIMGGGAAANRMKQSNVCAAAALGGNSLGIAYLAKQDPMFYDAAVASGHAIPIHIARKAKAEAEIAEAEARRVAPYFTCEMRNGKPYIYPKPNKRQEAIDVCMSNLGLQQSLQTAQPAPTQIPTCPTGSKFDGVGCWKPAR